MKVLREALSRRSKPAEPAPYGQLSPAIRREIQLIQKMNERRRETLGRYVGRTKATPLLTEIIRTVVLAYAEARCVRIGDIVEACRSYGSARTIRSAIQTLIDTGLATEIAHHNDRRTKAICATQRVVELYQSEVPWLRREFRRVLREFPL